MSNGVEQLAKPSMPKSHPLVMGAADAGYQHDLGLFTSPRQLTPADFYIYSTQDLRSIWGMTT